MNIVSRNRSYMATNKDSSFPNIDVVLQPPSESVYGLDRQPMEPMAWPFRSFGGTVGRLALSGSIKFIPRGSSGFDDIPLAKVQVFEPPALRGSHDISAAPYMNEDINLAGEVHWDVLYDDAVIASVEKALSFYVETNILPLFQKPS